ncbi:MAG: hypothetical protein QS721_06195 [Candidatus Endonucleobacter sp. (ex Gigantidas childressi)]|nr:hypothetical protein [Candidatus Endonucleobacter sp. (ex Gigantidas childressi)]
MMGSIKLGMLTKTNNIDHISKDVDLPQKKFKTRMVTRLNKFANKYIYLKNTVKSISQAVKELIRRVKIKNRIAVFLPWVRMKLASVRAHTDNIDRKKSTKYDEASTSAEVAASTFIQGEISKDDESIRKEFDLLSKNNTNKRDENNWQEPVLENGFTTQTLYGVSNNDGDR